MVKRYGCGSPASQVSNRLEDLFTCLNSCVLVRRWRHLSLRDRRGGRAMRDKPIQGTRRCRSGSSNQLRNQLGTRWYIVGKLGLGTTHTMYKVQNLKRRWAL